MTTMSLPTIPAVHGVREESRGHAPPVRPPEDFCLPRGYRQQAAAYTHDSVGHCEGAPQRDYWNSERIAASARWQHHVYAWGARLIAERGLKSVLDIGCGPGTKLQSVIAPVCSDITGLDQPSAITAAKRMGAPGRYSTIDLESCDDAAAPGVFDLVLCADVIEHLLDPDPLLRLIRRCGHERTLVLLSTPDRARLRGRGCMASEKAEHVREWTTPEFSRYLRSRKYAIESVRLLPGDHAPVSRGMVREWLWRARIAPTSPHRCLTILCRALPE